MAWAVKQSIKRLARKFGLEIIRYQPVPLTDRRRAARWLHQLGISVVLDVGANVGQFGSRLRASGYTGRIESFEPLAAPFAKLTQTAAGDPGWRSHQLALGGAKDSLCINVSANTESSSFLPMLDAHVRAAPQAVYTRSEQVSVQTLDDLAPQILGDADRVWLKLDVQGYEFAVIDGTSRTMPRLLGMEIELSNLPLYRDQILLPEALVRLRDRGFRLIGSEEVFVEPDTDYVLQYNGFLVRDA